MAKVIGWALVGCAYRNGFRMPGWTEARLDNGQKVIGPENASVNDILAKTDALGHSTEEMRKRTDEWVKTGVMPQTVV